jgi:predicted Zn-dependent protease
MEKVFRKKEVRFLSAIILSIALVLLPHPALSRDSILLDAETSHLLKLYSDPLIKVSGLSPHNIHIFLQATNQVNALASPGRIVLYSGLVLKTQTPEELQGVIAHEIAHIAAGHIPTLVEQRTRAGWVLVASQIIGLGAIIAGLAPLGVLVLAGGSSIGSYSALGETRTAEASADQAALSYLDRARISGRGLVNFFRREFLPKEQAYTLASRAAINPYTRTHPLSADRLRFLDKRVKRAASYNEKTPPVLQFAHNMVLAKLYGFTQTPQATMQKYSDNSMPSRYARAIMFAYHLADRKKSLAAIDSLIADQSNNPFFHELKGYVLSQGGNLSRAITSYQKALALAPDNLIMRLEIGNILVRSDVPALVEQGITHLRLAGQDPMLSRSTYRPIARGYGALGQIGLAELATAEALISENKSAAALRHAKRALKKIAASDRVSRLRAQDIIAILEDKTSAHKKRKKNR